MALIMLCGGGSLLAQINVSGTVVDESGNPIIGANVVLLNNKSVGTITDIDGKFTINADKKATLLVSYIGYIERKIEVGGRSSLLIKLKEDTQTLDEVVVVGYGSVKKSDLTTSVAQIKAETIEGRPLTSLSDALAGTLAGVQVQTSSGIPGEELQILVRGASSINSASTPLVVVDGVITESISDVNPSDVASIQVLKDAAATSIYGARGSAGVILVETKQAKSERPVITWESYVGLQDSYDLPDMMTSEEYIAYNMWYKNAYYLEKGGSMSVPNKNRGTGDQIISDWLANPDSDTADWTLNPNFSVTDWKNQILQTALTHSHQVSVSSKGKKYSLYMSGGYMDQDGIVKNTDFERFNFRINASVNINRYLRAGINFAPTISNQNRGESEGKDKVIMQALNLPPIIGLDEGTRELGFNPSYPTLVNPYERLMQVTDKLEKRIYSTSAWAELNILKGLKFKTMFNYNTENRIYEYFLPLNVQTYQVSSATGTTQTYSVARIGLQNTLDYSVNLLKKHKLNILLGQSIDERNTFNSWGAAMDFPLDYVYTLNMGATPTRAESTREIIKTSSLFGRVNYNYSDKYLMSASIRRDGSSRFGPGNRWALFPSVSAGWKISGENFMKKIKTINLLKLRASWGMSGNDRVGLADYIANYDATNAIYGGSTNVGIYAKNLPNEDLKWETTKALNVGFDLSMWRNRLQLNLDYYINRTDDLIYKLKLPAASGFDTMNTNIASLENRGWELELTTVNVSRGGFEWSTTINLSQNKNKILDLGGNNDIITQAWDASFITKVGGPISQFYGYKTDGILTSADFGVGYDGKYDINNPLVPVLTGQRPGNVRYVDSNKDGSITTDDMVTLGSNDPDLTYGFTNRFSYKGFELSVFLRGQVGGDIMYLAARSLSTGRAGYNQMSQWLHCYKEEYAGGDPIVPGTGVDLSWDGKTPLPYGFGNNSPLRDGQLHVTDLAIYDATFLRIQNISFGYNLPSKWLRDAHIRSAKLYFTAENLYTFTNYVGNPDVNSYSSNPMVRGVDYTTYPQARKYILGIKLTF